MKSIEAYRASKVSHLLAQRTCPTCGASVADTDRDEDRSWRSPDDVAAIRFGCGAEFSVEANTAEIISRQSCSNASQTAAGQWDIEADEEFGYEEYEEDPVNLAGSGPVPITPRSDDPHDAAPTAHLHHGDGRACWSPWGDQKLDGREA